MGGSQSPPHRDAPPIPADSQQATPSAGNTQSTAAIPTTTSTVAQAKTTSTVPAIPDARPGQDEEEPNQEEDDNPRPAETVEEYISYYPDLLIRIQQWHYCTICNKWLDGQHLRSKTHKSRFKYWWEQTPQMRFQAAVDARNHAVCQLQEQQSARDQTPAGPSSERPVEWVDVSAELQRQRDELQKAFQQVTGKHLPALRPKAAGPRCPPLPAHVGQIVPTAKVNAADMVPPAKPMPTLITQMVAKAAAKAKAQQVQQEVEDSRPPLERRKRKSR